MSLPDSLCHILVVWENVFFVCSLFLQDACWMFEPAAPTWNLFLSSPCVLNYTDIYCIFLLWIKDENKTKPTHYMDSDSSRQQSWFITVTIRSLTKWIKTVHAHLPPPIGLDAYSFRMFISAVISDSYSLVNIYFVFLFNLSFRISNEFRFLTFVLICLVLI